MGWVGAASAAGPVGTLRGELLLQCRAATAAALFAAPVAVEFTVWGRIE